MLIGIILVVYLYYNKQENLSSQDYEKFHDIMINRIKNNFTSQIPYYTPTTGTPIPPNSSVEGFIYDDFYKRIITGGRFRPEGVLLNIIDMQQLTHNIFYLKYFDDPLFISDENGNLKMSFTKENKKYLYSLKDILTEADSFFKNQTPDNIAGQFITKVQVEKINVDYESDRARSARVSSVPTVILVENGQEVRRFVGVRSYNDIINFING